MSQIPAQNGKVVLQATRLSKYFGAIKAVNEVSLTLEKGQCLAILGPNGAGKTTLCEMFEGLERQDSGTLEVLSRSYDKDRATILSAIGVTLQETSLYKRYTVLETLTLFASFYKHSLSVESMLRDLGLSEKRDVRLEQLSGGQKQKVYLGCAFIHDPEIIFLDEPTTGLDPKSRRELWDLIKKLKERQKSIVLTTHYMEEAEELADQILFLDQGSVVAAGTLPELLASFSCKETLELGVSSETLMLLKANHSYLENEVKTSRGFSFFVADAALRVQEILATCQKFSQKLAFVSVKEAGLEELFLKLTGREI